MFVTVLREGTMIVAQLHELIIKTCQGLGFQSDDKAMHFAVMAVLAMLLFFIVHFIFTRLAEWSITAISFIYVFTVMTALGFAIEIGQQITNTGNMDFWDVVAGLQGVLAFFLVYSVLRLIYWSITRLIGGIASSHHLKKEKKSRW